MDTIRARTMSGIRTCANLWKTFSRSALHVSRHDPPHLSPDPGNNDDDSQCTLQRFYVINTDAFGRDLNNWTDLPDQRFDGRGEGWRERGGGGEEGRVIVWLPSYVTVYNKCLATFLSFWRIQMMRFDSVIGSLLVFKKVSWKGKWSD